MSFYGVVKVQWDGEKKRNIIWTMGILMGQWQHHPDNTAPHTCTIQWQRSSSPTFQARHVSISQPPIPKIPFLLTCLKVPTQLQSTWKAVTVLKTISTLWPSVGGERRWKWWEKVRGVLTSCASLSWQHRGMTTLVSAIRARAEWRAAATTVAYVRNEEELPLCCLRTVHTANSNYTVRPAFTVNVNAAKGHFFFYI